LLTDKTESHIKERLETKAFVYEVEVLEIIERTKLNFYMYKYPIIKPSKNERHKPTELDDVVFDVKVS